MYDGKLYFAAGGSVLGRELYQYDGIQITFTHDIRPGPADGLDYPPELTVFDGKLYFKAAVSNSNYPLWRYDGMTFSIVDPMHNLETPFAKPTLFNGRLLVVGALGDTLYQYDGTQLTPLIANSIAESFAFITPLGNELVFRSQSSAYGTELFRFDGQTVSLLADLTPGSGRSEITEVVEAGGRVFVVARGGTLRPWTILTYDGTDFEPVPGASGISFPSGLTVFGDSLYFTAQNGDDFWLYRIQGVPEPPSVVLLAAGCAMIAATRQRMFARRRVQSTP